MSQLNPSEISSVLKEKIAGLDLSAERKNEGIIVSVSDGIVRIHGMGDVMYGEVIEFENGTKGMALNLEQDSVGAVVLGDYSRACRGAKSTLHRQGSRGSCGRGSSWKSCKYIGSSY